MTNNPHLPTGQFDPARTVLPAAPRESGPGVHGGPPRAVRLCWKGIVRLPGAQPLLLRRIERSLLAEDFRLDSDFAIFNRSARGQEMPPAEQVGARSKALRAAAMPAASLAAAGGAVVLSWLIANQLRTGPPTPPVTSAG